MNRNIEQFKAILSAQQWKEEEDQAECNKEEIDKIMEGLSHEEIVRRLRGTP